MLMVWQYSELAELFDGEVSNTNSNNSMYLIIGGLIILAVMVVIVCIIIIKKKKIDRFYNGQYEKEKVLFFLIILI